MKVFLSLTKLGILNTLDGPLARQYYSMLSLFGSPYFTREEYEERKLC